MPPLRLVRVGAVAAATAGAIAEYLAGLLGWAAQLDPDPIDPAAAFDPGRGQYWSTRLLQHLEARRPPDVARVLGVTEVDLFIPILTFVFGEGLLNRPPALISLRRLRPSYYGLPENAQLALDRAGKEAAHELGHTFGLVHCPDYHCLMRASRVADEIDLKGPGFCAECGERLRACGLQPARP